MGRRIVDRSNVLAEFPIPIYLKDDYDDHYQSVVQLLQNNDIEYVGLNKFKYGFLSRKTGIIVNVRQKHLLLAEDILDDAGYSRK
jgi:hypothetical protein